MIALGWENYGGLTIRYYIVSWRRTKIELSVACTLSNFSSSQLPNSLEEITPAGNNVAALARPEITDDFD